jgi:ABC-type bacteriocin/lantibiotic exporter with double-glycine peptidase domain
MNITEEGKRKTESQNEFISKMVDGRINISIAFIIGILVAMFSSSLISFMIPFVLFTITLWLTLNYQSKLETIYRNSAAEQIVYDTTKNINDVKDIRREIESLSNSAGEIFRAGTFFLKLSILSIFIPIFLNLF